MNQPASEAMSLWSPSRAHWTAVLVVSPTSTRPPRMARTLGPTTLVIVPGTGVGDLTGIVGNGGLVMDADGTHRIWFDYRLE